jgi:hypothetical protein
MIEIDPVYVDVAIRRWQALTGKDAIHFETGSTYYQGRGSPSIQYEGSRFVPAGPGEKAGTECQGRAGVGANPVSTCKLLKTGILKPSVRDFWDFERTWGR